MLAIRSDQVRLLEQQVLESHLDELVAHVYDFSPRLAAVLGPSRTRAAVSDLVHRAKKDGFLCRGPIQFYVDMGLLFGSGFSTDPQYPWIRATIVAEQTSNELDIAMSLYEKAVTAITSIHGSDNAFTWSALQRLLELSGAVPELAGRQASSAIAEELYAVHPEKVAFVGDAALSDLIEKAMVTATDMGFVSFRGQILIAALMFAFGHDCLGDSLYPWIAHTIEHPGIVEPSKRAARLERRAMIWLKQVLKSR